VKYCSTIYCSAENRQQSTCRNDAVGIAAKQKSCRFRSVLKFCRLFILPAASAVLLSGCSPAPAKKCGYARILLVIDGIYNSNPGFIAATLESTEIADESSGVSIQIHQKSSDPDGGVKAKRSVYFTPEPPEFEQCGKYSFTIRVNGEVFLIDDFHYRGEASITVFRGIGWYLQITRKEWDLLQ